MAKKSPFEGSGADGVTEFLNGDGGGGLENSGSCEVFFENCGCKAGAKEEVWENGDDGRRENGDEDCG